MRKLYRRTLIWQKFGTSNTYSISVEVDSGRLGTLGTLSNEDGDADDDGKEQ